MFLKRSVDLERTAQHYIPEDRIFQYLQILVTSLTFVIYLENRKTDGKTNVWWKRRESISAAPFVFITLLSHKY
jgi:hypothetical protein